MHLWYDIAIVTTPLAGGLAIIKGGPAERRGAAVFVGLLLATDAISALAPKLGYSVLGSMPYVDLVSTFAISAYFLYLAIRFGSLWLAAAMIVQASELYFARQRIDADPPNYHLYGVELDIICITVLLLLATGAVFSWRGRVLKRRDDKLRQDTSARRREEQRLRFETMLAERPKPAPTPKPAPGRVARLIIEPPPA